MKAVLGPVETRAWNRRAPRTPNLAPAPSSIHLLQFTLLGPPEPVSAQTRADPPGISWSVWSGWAPLGWALPSCDSQVHPEYESGGGRATLGQMGGAT